MINVIGNILGTTGYDNHTRQLTKALSKITEVRLSTQIPIGVETQLTNKEVELIKKKPQDNEINLIITNPMYWTQNTGAKRNWAYLIWEGDKIPLSWVEECLNPDIELILVPSHHTKQAIEKTAGEDMETIGDKIMVVPHGVDLDLFYPKKIEKENVTFLANKGFRGMEDRGGIQYLIKAYVEEFKPEEKVELLLKINPAYGIPNMAEIIKQIVGDKEKIPPIRIDTTNYKYEELVDIYAKASVFVSTTRAEAFNLPVLEAMACKLPIITTSFGGQADYTDTSTGWVVGGVLRRVEHELMYEETQWLTPNISELKQSLREAYSAKEQRQEKGKKALEKAKELTWDNSAEIIHTFI